MSRRSYDVKATAFPEIRVGGFTRIDGTIEFYNRVRALIEPEMEVLDFGAGRAAWTEDTTSPYRNDLRTLRGSVARVVGCDVDPAVLKNPVLDEAHIIDAEDRLPFSDKEFDLVIADYVFEHLENPRAVTEELARVTRPGGWICARTPNRLGLVPLLTRAIPNRRHTPVLRHVQPERRGIDVFPTHFKLNSEKQLREYFRASQFQLTVYHHQPEPSYYSNSRLLFSAWMIANKLIPKAMYSSLVVFLQRKFQT